MNSHVPCRGFVEWIAEAWLDSDIESISQLLCEILRANPVITITLSIRIPKSHYDSNNYIEESYKKLPEIIKEIKFDDIINGLNAKQMATLISAYMLQAKIGCSDESIMINNGRFLMAASILPWKFNFDQHIQKDCINNVNYFIRHMRKDPHFWEEVPLCEPENFASFDRIKFDSIFPILQRMIPLSTSARWHLLDAISYDQLGKVRTIDKRYRIIRSLDWCTFYETRRFGCNTDETSKEILDSGLVTLDVPLHLIERKYSKNDLMEVLLKNGIIFKKSQKINELMALVKEYSINDLLELSNQRKYFLLTNELEAKGEILREIFCHQANRLGLWAAGTLVPRIKDIEEKEC